MNAMDYNAIQAMRDAEIQKEREYQASVERFDRYQEAVERAAKTERALLLTQPLGDVLDHLSGPFESQMAELVDLIANDLARAKLEVIE